MGKSISQLLDEMEENMRLLKLVSRIRNAKTPEQKASAQRSFFIYLERSSNGTN